jgi:hypothetical protein
MEVRIIYFDDCPHWRPTTERLREALARVGQADTPVVLTRLQSDEPPAGFAGSPTILVDGQDLFPGAALPDGLVCRLFSTSEGLAGSPTVDKLITALKNRSRMTPTASQTKTIAD